MFELIRGAGWRRVLVLTALLALVLKIAVPPGFMPGTSLSVPIIVCPGQDRAIATGHHGGHGPSKPGHDEADHPCAFTALGLAAIAAPVPGPDPMPVVVAVAAPIAMAMPVLAPGRGLAAPPPPSRAPPVLST